ncbi:MAG TPA: macro domain-containing protein [Amycolatopsis sp.]|uniref:macro domain-containing protein n=1 Tax=Amycolatopsis sp. TaxID=37632 RepID=UPI002F3F9362
MHIRILDADITTLEVDVIVNAANSSLLGGGGVDGAIHRKGGPAILAECRQLRAGHYGKGLKTGQAVATTAGNLPARWVVHTVGPVWSDSEDRSGLLADCHRNSLQVARELGAETVARAEPGSIREVVFALRGEAAVEVFRARHNSLA